MKEAFATACRRNGWTCRSVTVMYPGFKFGEGDHVVEIAKQALQKLIVHVNYNKVVAAVMQML